MTKIFKMPSLKTFLFSVTGYVVAVLVVYAVKGLDVDNILFSLLYLVSFFYVAWAFWSNSLTYGTKSVQGKAFLLLSIALLPVIIGQTIWFFQQIFPNFISLQILIYTLFLVAYVVAIPGLILEIKTLKINWTEKHIKESSILILMVILLGIFLFRLEIFPIFQNGLSEPLNIVLLATGLGDFILLILGSIILRLAIEFKGGLLYKSWLCIFIAQALILVSDAFIVVSNNFILGISPGIINLFQLLLLIANLVAAYGFYGIGDAIRVTQNDIIEMSKHQEV